MTVHVLSASRTLERLVLGSRVPSAAMHRVPLRTLPGLKVHMCRNLSDS